MNHELIAAAQAYHELGIPVIPFKIWKNEKSEYEKKNIGYWAKWQTEPQTEAEFKALDWREANGLGIILGTKANNGLYLSAIDYDVKGTKISEEAKAIGKQILRELPITQTDETANGGIHLMYWSRNPVETDGTFLYDAALELLGSKKLCVIPPSFAYKRLNDNTPTEIENLEETFYSALKHHGIKKTEETEIEHQQDNYSFQISKLVDLSQMTQISGCEYQGKHPIHDSTTEKNFCVNTKTNTWFCFRHNSGGGALQYLAMKEGIIKCEHAKRGALRGKKFKDVLALAASQNLIDQKVLEQSEINPIILAKDIMEDYTFITEKETNTLYYYNSNEGIYSTRTEQLLKREIARRLDENTKVRYYAEVDNFIRSTAPLVELNSSPDLIVVKNGVLNTVTRELKPFNPDYYLTIKLPIEYDKNADCTANHKFHEEVLDEKYIRQAQELLGHTLTRKILQEVCAILNGKGGNGKSIFLDILTAFLGAENISNHTIQNLCYEKFVTIEVKDKLANINADLPSKEIQSTGIYKQLVSGDRVTGYLKHVQTPIYFKPFAKYWFSANTIPPINSADDCHAWFRRFVFLDFNRTFTKENAKPRQQLLAELTTPQELSGLLNWALDGLARLRENGDISDRPSSEEIRKEWIKRSNSALAYLESQVKVTDVYEDYVFTDILYRAFITYCHENKLPTQPKAALTKTLQQYCNGAEHTKIRPDGKNSSPLSAWRYIKLANSVPSVPPVPAFPTLLQKSEKITLEKNAVLEKKFENSGTSGTDGTPNKPDNQPQPDYIHIEALTITITDKDCDRCKQQKPLEFTAKNKHGKAVCLCADCATEAQQ